MRKRPSMLLAVAALFFAALAPVRMNAQSPPATSDLTGAWRGKVQLTTGMFASLKDLQYMYVFHAGGTMTESSNYDAVPPVPPAYGVWRRTGPRAFEARYEWFQSKSAATSAELIKNSGWLPDGHGVIRQSITLSADGNSFTSKISIEMFDKAGKAISGGGSGTATAERIRF